MTDTLRKIIHVDMDCFYAAVEERENPDLRGRPLGVGGTGGRGVLTTCNYEARKYGVRSAMPTFMALARCPQLVMVRPRFDLYRAESAKVRAILAEYSPLLEPLSLDEAYLDVTHHERPASVVAAEIRARILETTQLTASAGIAPNKMLAKIASDYRKPDGQFTIKPSAIAAFMADLPTRKIHGIGEVTAKRLEEVLKAETCGQLQAFDRAELQGHFGKFGHELYDRCRGIDSRPVEANRPRKSLSNESTFRTNLTAFADCVEKLDELHAELLLELEERADNRPIHKVFVKVKFSDFTHTTVERVGTEPALDTYRALLEEGWRRRPAAQRIVRLIGVGVRFVMEQSIEENPASTSEADAPEQYELF